MKRSTTYKTASILIKITIVLVALWFLYRQVFIKHDFAGIQAFYRTVWLNPEFFPLAAIVSFLMIINWTLEAIKWKMMISKMEEISFFRAMEAVFAGITVSFFTPNRVGEFGGRIFFLVKADQVKAALISIFGSMSQLIITLIMGSFSLLLFLFNFTSIQTTLFYSVTFLTIIADVLLLFIYFNLAYFQLFLQRIKVLQKFLKYSEIIELYSFSELRKVLLLSFLRYAVFTTQYLILLRMMDIQVPLLGGIIMIAMTFLVMSVPTFALSEFSLRSVVALQFIGLLSSNSIGIVTASFSLYLINVALPALLGAVFVFNLKFFRNTK